MSQPSGYVGPQPSPGPSSDPFSLWALGLNTQILAREFHQEVWWTHNASKWIHHLHAPLVFPSATRIPLPPELAPPHCLDLWNNLLHIPFISVLSGSGMSDTWAPSQCASKSLNLGKLGCFQRDSSKVITWWVRAPITRSQIWPEPDWRRIKDWSAMGGQKKESQKRKCWQYASSIVVPGGMIGSQTQIPCPCGTVSP